MEPYSTIKPTIQNITTKLETLSKNVLPLYPNQHHAINDQEKSFVAIFKPTFSYQIFPA
jgi:hypothetical protein